MFFWWLNFICIEPKCKSRSYFRSFFLIINILIKTLRSLKIYYRKNNIGSKVVRPPEVDVHEITKEIELILNNESIRYRIWKEWGLDPPKHFLDLSGPPSPHCLSENELFLRINCNLLFITTF